MEALNIQINVFAFVFEVQNAWNQPSIFHHAIGKDESHSRGIESMSMPPM